MIAIQNYVRAQSLEEAWELNQKKRNRVIGGMLWLKMGRGSVNTAIDLCDLGLDTIEETAGEFTIGAMVTLRQLELHPGLNAYTQGAMAKAVKDIVGVQFRNIATVGGSIWGRFGFSEFVNRKYDRDILVELIVKKVPARFSYQAMRIQRTDFPVITCALSDLHGEIRACIGARPNKAMVIRGSRGLSPAAFAQEAARQAPTGSNIRGSAAYRSHLIRVLTQRALEEIGGAT